jgi:tetratricopeptide (TPR) repeat protein
MALERVEAALRLNDGVAYSWELRALSLFAMGRLREALDSLERCCSIHSEQCSAWYYHGLILQLLNRTEDSKRSFERVVSLVPTESEVSLRFRAAVRCNRLDVARADWGRMLAELKQEENRHTRLYLALMLTARPENASFLRGLISESNLDEEFFPLARAFDFLATGDEQLIEKLSPEMRPIVVGIVASIQAKSAATSRR